jgi:hypothetical protein
LIVRKEPDEIVRKKKLTSSCEQRLNGIMKIQIEEEEKEEFGKKIWRPIQTLTCVIS